LFGVGLESMVVLIVSFGMEDGIGTHYHVLKLELIIFTKMQLLEKNKNSRANQFQDIMFVLIPMYTTVVF
jgi:hypothetical protein